MAKNYQVGFERALDVRKLDRMYLGTGQKKLLRVLSFPLQEVVYKEVPVVYKTVSKQH